MTNRLARLLPVLAGLSPVELEFVLTSYGSYKFSRRHMFGVHFAEYVFVGLILCAEIVGTVGGWIWRHDLWGLLAGSMSALAVTLILAYVAHRVGTLISIWWWLKSEQGKFVLRHTKFYERWTLDKSAPYEI